MCGIIGVIIVIIDCCGRLFYLEVVVGFLSRGEPLSNYQRGEFEALRALRHFSRSTHVDVIGFARDFLGFRVMSNKDLHNEIVIYPNIGGSEIMVPFFASRVILESFVAYAVGVAMDMSVGDTSPPVVTVVPFVNDFALGFSDTFMKDLYK